MQKPATAQLTISFPPKGQRKKMVWVLAGIELIAATLLILAHTFIGESTAVSLLAMSEQAFDGTNTQILYTILLTLFTSFHLEALLILLILSLRTVLVLQVVTSPILESKRWMVRLIVPSNILWLLATVGVYYLLVITGLAVFLIPALLFLFFFASWPIAYVAAGGSKLLALRTSYWQTATAWRRLVAPFLVFCLLQIVLSWGVGYSLFGLAQIHPWYGLPLLFLSLAAADVVYLFWAKQYLRVTRPVLPSQPLFPKWIVIIATIGAGIMCLLLFVFVKSLAGISNDSVLRSQLVYDLLPKAETRILTNWQRQLQLQKEQATMTPDQQAALDQLINQMSIEYKNQATASGEINPE